MSLRNTKWIVLAVVLVFVIAGAIQRMWGVRAVSHDGQRFQCKRVMVTFSETATAEMMLDAAKSVRGNVVNEIPELRSYTLALPGRCQAKTVLEAVDTLKKQPGVINAESVRLGSLAASGQRSMEAEFQATTLG